MNSSSSSSSPPSLLLLPLSASASKTSMSTINGENHHHHQQQQKTDSNEPAESFYLSKQEEIDWLNKNSIFFERKGSTKRKSTSTTTNSTSILSSISLKSKPGTSSIIGLPQTQKSCFTIRKNCKPSKARFFPKRRSKSSVPPPSEPSSPKVSCIGRVRSKKEQHLRSRSLRIHHDQIHHNNNNNNHRSTEEKENEKKNPKRNKTGFWSNFKAVFRIGCQKPKEGKEEELVDSPLKKKKTEKVGSRSRSRRTFSDPPVFGELKRFVSGRKSESWGGGELSSDDDDAEFDSNTNRSGGGGQCSKNGEANVPPLFGELKRFASGRK